ncbi:chemokine XC receptor 1-like [Trichomycterus rosablanca]|uniref:chemokine XC receptor 1-like n=1 Tax=Trichomycterus rosablanca TaxID=2290929 RepID=UPI002F34FEB7
MSNDLSYGNYTDEYPNYTFDYSDDACNDTEVRRFESVVTPIFFTIVIILSCVGNVLVLWILNRYENLSSLTNAFLVNVAISDLLFTAGLPFWASYHVWGWTFGNIGCKLVSFVFYLGYYSSLIFLTVMTVHRYMAVMYPLSVALNKKPDYCIVMSVVIWFFSICAATPNFIFKKLVFSSDNEAFCDYQGENHFWKLFGIFQQNIFFLVAFITIAFCYTCILGRLLRPMSHTRPKTVKLILCIVIVFFIGWMPYNVTIFLDSLITWQVSPFNICEVSKTVGYIHNISRLIAFSHCCLNPVFYVFVGIKFRSHLKKMLKNLCGHEEQSQHRHSRFIYSNGEEISMY